MTTPLRALSLTQPWLSWAILTLGKRIENRDWTEGCRYRGRLALHAAKGLGTREDFDATVTSILGIAGIEPPATKLIRDVAVWNPKRSEWAPSATLPRSSILAVCNLVGVIEPGADGRLKIDAAEPAKSHAKTDEQRRWHFGGFALVLDDVVTLREPVPCKGALGLWRVPADVAAKVEAQL